jgi:valine--pyruvate aminotransferase
VPARPFWAEHVILTMSLSKLGLPGARTGIVVAPEPIAAAVAGRTAIVGLANGTIGEQIALPWVEDGSILRIGRDHLRPFYAAKATAATARA